MIKRLLLLAGITVALLGTVSAAIPWPPCNPCLVNTATVR
jgi:hypothetical protein